MLVAASLTYTNPANGASLKTLQKREARQSRAVYRYSSTLRFFRHHPQLAHTRVGRREVRRAHLWLTAIRRELRETRYYLHRPLFPTWWLAEATCIHEHEGAWNANTGNGYYGGMQFLLSTWRSVGGTGYPHLQSPQEQLRRAFMVWKRDGGSWAEWGTRGMCGV